mmetsp:Transcript_108812/g.306638  ORF Transcript_108812/g.306638 Transcript_108812/m.306638 type:complete len:160 (+) Transcript_108812:65-544(+)
MLSRTPGLIRRVAVKPYYMTTLSYHKNIITNEPYTEKQAKMGRPVAPHVTIYKWPAAAVSSIINRVTGVTLTFGITGVGALALVGVDVPAFMSMLGDITIVGNVAKFGVTYPLLYHYLGGIRHLVWDRKPELLTNDLVEKSSFALIGTATVLSCAIALL